MQCVIIAAGKGTRMRPLTDDLAKPLIKVCGKPILDHIVEALPTEITDLILVVGYKQEQIREHCGTEFHGRAVKYVEQTDFAGGTGDALFTAKDMIKGKFLLLNGDDIYGREGLKKIIQCESGIFSATTDTPERFGVLNLNEDGTLREIVEKPEQPETNLINIGGYVLQDEIFSYELTKSHLGEYLVTDLVTAYAKDHSTSVIEQDLWLPIGYPEHIAAAEKVLCPENVESQA